MLKELIHSSSLLQLYVIDENKFVCKDDYLSSSSLKEGSLNSGRRPSSLPGPGPSALPIWIELLLILQVLLTHSRVNCVYFEETAKLHHNIKFYGKCIS